MTLEEALLHTLKGEKIKLPEWSGYWFREDGRLRVFCKNGDIVDTPHYDKYNHRTDWQITDGIHGFDFAIQAIKAGHSVRRREWKPGRYIALHITNEIHQYIRAGNISDIVKTDMTWVPNQVDLFATNWEKIAAF